MFLSRQYADKLWTNHERRATQVRAFRERNEYILPLRLDDTKIPGILETTGYLDLRQVTINRVSQLLKAKLDTRDTSSGSGAQQVYINKQPAPSRLDLLRDNPVLPNTSKVEKS